MFFLNSHCSWGVTQVYNIIARISLWVFETGCDQLVLLITQKKKKKKKKASTNTVQKGLVKTYMVFKMTFSE